MNCLLDTHTLLWYLQNSKNLSDRTTEILEDVNHNLSLSIASLWEISIKLGLGKLRLQKSFSELEDVLQDPVSESKRYVIRNCRAIAPSAAKI
jgi:PIN domain nuclease of toxin-antitoxin system